MFINEHEELKFNRVFDIVYQSLDSMRKTNPAYKIEDLEKFVQSLYVNDGNNWLGRGEIKNTVNNATIVAAETVLSEWKNSMEE